MTLPGRLVLLLAAVALIGLVTAAFGHFVLGAFPTFGEALWSATAHLVDPGSIGDDVTLAERLTGLVQVIAGIIFFAGVVLTVLTEVVDRALRRLEKGDPAVRRKDHLLIVGYNPSLWEVQERLSESSGENAPEIVVMLPLAESGRRDDARRALAGYSARTTVVVTEPSNDGYERVCARDARGIVLLSPIGQADTADLQVTDRATLLESHLADLGQDAPSVAVEFRRARNVKAFWEPTDDDSRDSRFPSNFDALVNDRNIGAMLLLAVLNAEFASVLLDDDDGNFSPTLISPGGPGRETFAEATNRLLDYNLLGVLRGSGPNAEVTYLPDGDLVLGTEDRLVVVPRESPRVKRQITDLPPSLKVVPTRPGSILMIGWSDASTALIQELEETGANLGLLHLLDFDAPDIGPTSADISIKLLAGDPVDPDDIAAAISRTDPEIIWVAVPDGNESAAIISGLLARRETTAPILVEQPYSNKSHRNQRVTSDLIVVSTGGIIANTVAMSLNDPAVLVARERLLGDPHVRLESLTYMGNDSLQLNQLQEAFSEIGAVPLAVSLEEEGQESLQTGDRILTFHRQGAS